MAPVSVRKALYQHRHNSSTVSTGNLHPRDPARLDASQLALKLCQLLKHFESYPAPRKTLSIGTATILRLTGSESENMWVHYDGSNCGIKVMPSAKERDGLSDIELSGSPRAQEIATKWLLSHDHDNHDSGIKLRRQAHMDLDRYSRVEETPLPPVWTLKSFLEYVQKIVRFRPHHTIDRLIYPGGQSHVLATAKLLHSTFLDPSTKPYVSAVALQVALRFLRKHSETSKFADDLWQHAIGVGIKPHIAVFNEEIGRALMHNRWNRFQGLCAAMKNFGVQPDPTTWAATLSYVETPDSRKVVLRALKHSSVLERPDARRKIACVMVRKDFEHFVNMGDGINMFLQRMNTHFGKDWFNSQILESMLRACSSSRIRSRWAKVSEILKVVEKTYPDDFILSRDALLHLMRTVQKTGNMEDAIELLKAVAKMGHQWDREAMLDTFFQLAFAKRWCNICRVVWHYSACAGLISRKMYHLVRKNLTSNVSKERQHSKRMWELYASKHIVGTNLDTENFRQIFPLLGDQMATNSPINVLQEWTTNDGARNEQMLLVHLIMERDRNAWTLYHRMKPDEFFSLLDQAYGTDTAWHGEQLTGDKMPARWKGDVVQIPLKKRTFPLSLEKSLIRPFVIHGYRLDRETLTRVLPQEGTSQETVRPNRFHNQAERVPAQKHDPRGGSMKHLKLGSSLPGSVLDHNVSETHKKQPYPSPASTIITTDISTDESLQARSSSAFAPRQGGFSEKLFAAG